MNNQYAACLLVLLSSACSSSGNDSALTNGGTDASGGAHAGGGSRGAGIAGASTSGSSSAGTSSGGSSSGGAGGGGSASGGVTTYTPKSCAEGSSTELPENAPVLSTDAWTNISPPAFAMYPDSGGNFALAQGMTIDPCNPTVLYVCVPTSGANVVEEGLWRSNDAGATWQNVHNFGSCVNVRVDPEDPLHLYVGDGVAGGANGFFVSTDGGKTWAMPPGFLDYTADGGTFDVYHVEPDPTDFDHVLVTFHSGWSGGDSAVIESFNGGETFTKSTLVGGDFAGGYDVYYLYEPELGIGNSQTWLFATQGKGHFRTTDSGKTWTKVSDVHMQHGGGTTYYTAQGVLYVSSAEGVLKSTNNGESFVLVGPHKAYLSVIGDGVRLYTGQHFNSRFMTALESDDGNWTELTEQDFAEGPFEMALDEANGILYSANVRAGVFALKVGN